MNFIITSLLTFVSLAINCLADSSDPGMHPYQNLKPKCTPYDDRRTCSMGIEMNLGVETGARWTGLFVYDSNCSLLVDFDLEDAVSSTHIVLQAHHMPAPLVVTDWQTGEPWLDLGATYDGHIEFSYLGLNITSDLKVGVRQGLDGNMCNCYAGNPLLIAGGNCDRDICCGCAFDCSGDGGMRPAKTRPKGYFGEVEGKHGR